MYVYTGIHHLIRSTCESGMRNIITWHVKHYHVACEALSRGMRSIITWHAKHYCDIRVCKDAPRVEVCMGKDAPYVDVKIHQG